MATVQQQAQAGTLESSDMLVLISPAGAGSGITVELTSSTMQQFGDHMKRLIEDILQQAGVTDAVVQATDKGAIDCIIEARVKTALARAMQ